MMNSEKPSLETQILQDKAKLGSFNTQKAYASDWKLFENYCQSQGYESLPASAVVVANYLASCKKYAWHTLQRKLAAIWKQHSLAGYTENPCQHRMVLQVLEGWKERKA